MATHSWFYRSQILFEADTIGYYIYGIPSLTATQKGALLAFLSIRMSYDEGLTWPVSKVIDPYIAVTSDGLIHVFYEGGSIHGTVDRSQNTHMSLVSFDLEWLRNGNDKLSTGDKPLNHFLKSC